MISKVFEWAWQCGLEVEMYSKNFQLAVYEEVRYRPRESSDFVKIDRVIKECPVLKFRRGDRSIEIMGENWAMLARELEHRHKSIWADLNCPPLEL